MPSHDLFEFSVIVNDECLQEYKVDSAFYIEANLYSPVSFFIEEEDLYGCKQKYPVTPFRVKGHVKNTTARPCFIKLSVDGQQVFMKPFPANMHVQREFNVMGYKYQNEVRELLFSLPRLTEDKMELRQTSGRNSNIGTIKVECLEAVAVGTFNTWRQDFCDLNKPGGLSQMPQFSHASKKQCGSSIESVGVATREGRSIGQFSNSRRHMKTMIRYNLGKAHLGELCVKYRPRMVLQELGIRNAEWESSKKMPSNKESTASTETEKTDMQKLDEDTILCQKKVEKMRCYSPTREHDIKNPSKLFFFSPNAKLKCFSPTATGGKMSHYSPSDIHKKTIKQEKIPSDDDKQYRLIEIDDDIQMLEEIDDDVVWMGDESCCFIDVEDPEVSMIDLCAE